MNRRCQPLTPGIDGSCFMAIRMPVALLAQGSCIMAKIPKQAATRNLMYMRSKVQKHISNCSTQKLVTEAAFLQI